MVSTRRSAVVIVCALLALPHHAAAQSAPAPVPESEPAPAGTQPQTPDEAWAVHGQSTFTEQYHPAFASAFRGPNSLDPGSRGDETFDMDLYAGFRPWTGAEIWADAEIDQGFGLSNTVGIAAYPSAEAYKVGAADPYARLPRLFLRQTIDLGGSVRHIDPDLTTLGSTVSADRIVVTIGKFSVPDIFDANSYAHDPRQDFMNWALVDSATFDYAADAWGFTYGAAVEWYQDWWTLRAGAFALSRIPNDRALDTSGGQDQYIAEAEERHTLWGEEGRVRVTGFLSRAHMGDYLQAVALADQTGDPVSIAAVRNYRSRTGISLDAEQAVTSQLGAFLRAGVAEGGREVYEFTDADKTLAVGLSLQGKSWNRPDDTIGVATAIDDISRREKTFLNAGGLGILIGDGRLPDSGPEQVIEAYYSTAIRSYLHLTADYQFVNNPAYNRDRGPVSIIGARLHFQY